MQNLTFASGIAELGGTNQRTSSVVGLQSMPLFHQFLVEAHIKAGITNCWRPA
jgi:hypothetical protein